MPRKVVEVTWEDARVSVDGCDLSLPLMTSYGVIVSRDKKKVCVCSLFGESGEPRVVQSIPTVLVQSIKKIK